MASDQSRWDDTAYIRVATVQTNADGMSTTTPSLPAIDQRCRDDAAGSTCKETVYEIDNLLRLLSIKQAGCQ